MDFIQIRPPSRSCPAHGKLLNLECDLVYLQYMSASDRIVVTTATGADAVPAVRELLGSLAPIHPEWFAEGSELKGRLDEVDLLPPKSHLPKVKKSGT